jgi:2,3-bisphosphoglycerate-independent phosphoglycerate mutase
LFLIGGLALGAAAAAAQGLDYRRGDVFERTPYGTVKTPYEDLYDYRRERARQEEEERRRRRPEIIFEDAPQQQKEDSGQTSRTPASEAPDQG